MSKGTRVRLLNVEVDDLTVDEVVRDFREGLLLTLHVDMIMKLQKDKAFYDLLPQFDLITCDSQILFVAAKLLGTPLRQRVSGSDLLPLFYKKYANDPSFTIFICGGGPGVAQLALRNINAKVGRQMVVGADAPPKDFDSRPGELEAMVARINDSRANVLVVGLGAGRQEKFICQYRDRMPYVKTFLPFGGAIDYEAGSLTRPAAWITDIGLEWLYRVMREPRQRWYRYFVHQPPVLPLLAKQKLGLYRNPFEFSPTAGGDRKSA